MTYTKSEQLEVQELFQFEDGTTVIVGEYTGSDAPIGQCEAQVIIDGVFFTSIRVTGERMPGPALAAGNRSIITKSLSRQDVAKIRAAKYVKLSIKRDSDVVRKQA